MRSRAETVPPHAGVRHQETQKWWENFLGNRLLRENEMAAFKKLVRCSKTTGSKQSVIFLYKSNVSGSTTEKNQEEKRGYCGGCNY